MTVHAVLSLSGFSNGHLRSVHKAKTPKHCCELLISMSASVGKHFELSERDNLISLLEIFRNLYVIETYEASG